MSKPEFVYVTYIETTPEKLWEALTPSEFTRRYWFGTELHPTGRSAQMALVMNGTVTDTGEILESDRPQRLSYTFQARTRRRDAEGEAVKSRFHARAVRQLRQAR